MNLAATLKEITGDIQEKSPKLLVGLGIVTFAATIVTASRATLKMDKLVDEAKDKLEKIENYQPVTKTGEDGAVEEEVYTEKDRKTDKTIVYAQTGLEILKMYVPSIILGSLSVMCFLKSNNILEKRNLAIAGAYTTLNAAFSRYRKRVIEKYGEEEDYNLMHGITTAEVVELDEKGKEHKKTVTASDGMESPYTRYFTKSNPYWQDYVVNVGANSVKGYDELDWFIKSNQNALNDLLRARYDKKKKEPGKVTFNEALDALGFPVNLEEGLVTGWTYDPDRTDGLDNFIEFDVKQCKISGANGELEDAFSIDFNVEGVIYKKSLAAA